MQYMNCPEGTRIINIHMNYNEATDLLSNLNQVVEEFDWDDFPMQSLRNTLERAIQIEDSRANGEEVPGNDRFVELGTEQRTFPAPEGWSFDTNTITFDPSDMTVPINEDEDH